MEAQDYLNLSVNQVKKFMDKTTMYRRQFDETFQKASTQDEVYNIIDGFDENQSREYFSSSEILISIS